MDWTNSAHVTTYHTFYAALWQVAAGDAAACHAQAESMVSVWLAEFATADPEV